MCLGTFLSFPAEQGIPSVRGVDFLLLLSLQLQALTEERLSGKDQEKNRNGLVSKSSRPQRRLRTEHGPFVELTRRKKNQLKI